MNHRRNVRRSALHAKPVQPTSLSASEMAKALVGGVLVFASWLAWWFLC
jgi:hypothetical protein